MDIEGKITVGGKVINPVAFRKNIAYVMQDDALMATSSPREALRFSATLRLPQTTPINEIHDLVERLIEELGIKECADTFVGNALIKGISGGQRKRTSIGIELITNPVVSIVLAFAQCNKVYICDSCCFWMSLLLVWIPIPLVNYC